MNYCLTRKQREMAESRRRSRDSTMSGVQIVFLQDTVTLLLLLFCLLITRSLLHHPPTPCPGQHGHRGVCPCCPLSPGYPFFWSFPLAVVCSYLTPLSCTQHPVCTGAGQTLSLCDTEDISQAITFSAWARYLYNCILPACGSA